MVYYLKTPSEIHTHYYSVLEQTNSSSRTNRAGLIMDLLVAYGAGIYIFIIRALKPNKQTYIHGKTP